MLMLSLRAVIMRARAVRGRVLVPVRLGVISVVMLVLLVHMVGGQVGLVDFDAVRGEHLPRHEHGAFGSAVASYDG